jgi:hypothetical protein
MDLRRQNDAAEGREPEEEEKDDDEEKDEDDEEEDEEADGEEAVEGDPEAEAEVEDEDEMPKKKPKKEKKVAVKKTPVKRTRAVKEVRKKAVWVVFDNGGKRVETFPFPQKAEAEDLLAKKIEEKKTTFYIQLVKDDLDS